MAPVGPAGALSLAPPRLARPGIGHAGYLLRQIRETKSYWIRVDGTDFHYRAALEAAVDAPGVVLVHGIGVSSRYMCPLLQHLAPFCRVYAPDLPGCGLTRPKVALDLDATADALARFMEAVGIPRATLIGNSMGCQTLVRFAQRHPARLEKAVFTGPTLDPAARTRTKQLYRWARTGLEEPLSLGLVLLQEYWDCGLRRMWRTFLFALEDRMEERLPSVRVPALVVRGTGDHVAPDAWARRVAALLPQGRLLVLPGAAHGVNYDAPLELARVLRPFLLDGSASHPDRTPDLRDRAPGSCPRGP